MRSSITPIRRALISVSDKTGLLDLAHVLAEQGVEIMSTGGSAAALVDAGLPVIEVADYTGFPEIMDGRVKTLQPRIHGGLLAVRENSDHVAAMHDHGIQPIDLLVCNLYPFSQTLASGADYETCVENIDIGGPALIRASAKNHAYVTVIVSPSEYGELISELQANDGGTSLEFRKTMALRAFARTASYDAQISGWLSRELDDPFPPHIAVGGGDAKVLRYGENPHQAATFYKGGPTRPGVATAHQIQGKDLSFNNFNDADAAFELASEFESETACVIVKHANPCGVATGASVLEAYEKALICDTESAFGGIVALNRPLSAEAAEAMINLFLEVIIAPSVDEEAQQLLRGKKNLRILTTGQMANPRQQSVTVRSLAGGLLFQTRDNASGDGDYRIVTKRHPTPTEIADMLFAATVAKHVKSNAIVYAKNGATVGIGAGQMSRVNSSRIAAWKAEDAAEKAGESDSFAIGSVVASDAFFPFPDGLLAAVDAGATAVVQPGGSVRDDMVIKAADDAGVAMIFTGVRNFRH